MAQVTIGGEVYEVPPLSFKGLKRVWPLLEQAANQEDPFANVEAALGVVAEAISKTDYAMTVDEMEDKMSASEVPLLEQTMEQIMADAGLVKVKADGTIIRKGEDSGEATGEAMPPSTETSTDTSLNSLPPVAPAETGN